MTVEEFIQEITLEYDLDGNKILPNKYEILLNIEIENEAYEKPERINIEIESIEIDHKFKTIKLIGD
jgi:hypothetical protein